MLVCSCCGFGCPLECFCFLIVNFFGGMIDRV